MAGIRTCLVVNTLLKLPYEWCWYLMDLARKQGEVVPVNEGVCWVVASGHQSTNAVG